MVISSSPLESSVQDVFFLEKHLHTFIFQLPHRCEGVDGVASKPGDAFGDDQVDFS